MKGYLAVELLRSLVSPDFQTLQMDGIPPRLKHSKGYATRQRKNQGHFITYVSKYCTRQKSGFDSFDVCLFYVSQGEVHQMSLAKMQTVWYLAKHKILLIRASI